MDQNEKRAYLEAIRKRYRKGKRSQKSKILDEFCEVCGYSRKYAIRDLSQPKRKKPKKPGRRPWYTGERILTPLQAIWLACAQMCSKKLKAALREWLPHYEKENRLLDDIVRRQLNGVLAIYTI